MNEIHEHRPDYLRTFRLLRGVYVVTSKSRDPFAPGCYSHTITLYVRKWCMELTVGRFEL